MKHADLRNTIRMKCGGEELIHVDAIAHRLGLLLPRDERPGRVYLALMLVLAALQDAGEEVPGGLTLSIGEGQRETDGS